jgi:hypothetical protein
MQCAFLPQALRSCEVHLDRPGRTVALLRPAPREGREKFEAASLRGRIGRRRWSGRPRVRVLPTMTNIFRSLDDRQGSAMNRRSPLPALGHLVDRFAWTTDLCELSQARCTRAPAATDHNVRRRVLQLIEMPPRSRCHADDVEPRRVFVEYPSLKACAVGHRVALDYQTTRRR